MKRKHSQKRLDIAISTSVVFVAGRGTFIGGYVGTRKLPSQPWGGVSRMSRRSYLWWARRPRDHKLVRGKATTALQARMAAHRAAGRLAADSRPWGLFGHRSPEMNPLMPGLLETMSMGGIGLEAIARNLLRSR